MISLKGQKITPKAEAASESQITSLPETIHLALDTEYAQKDSMSVLCVTGYVPHCEKELYFDESELTSNWSVLQATLAKLNFKVESVHRRKAQDILTKHWKRYFPQGTKADIEKLKQNRVLQIECENCDINIQDCEIYLNKRGEIKLGFKRFKVNIVGFFLYADLFKIFGREKGYLFSEEAKLQQFRTIKILGKIRETLSINGIPCDFQISVFDCRYVFPPIPANLDNQLRVFKIEGNKTEISVEIKKRYSNTVTEKWCKENMDIVKIKYPDIFREYAVNDAVLTWKLYERLNQLMAQVCELLEIPATIQLGETCGGNIQKILLGLIYKHFGASEKEEIKFLDSIIEKGTAKYLSQRRGNDYGVVPFLTTGGLLFTRCIEHPLIKETNIDLDESSCYATSLTSMNIYLGQPRVNTFFSRKPKLRDRICDAEEMNVPKDAIYWNVSGKLNRAINTLVLSDLRFEDETTISDNYKAYSFSDVLNNLKDTINLYDVGKITEPSSYSKILTKEIHFGKITFATITALKDLPEEWFEEYLDLEVLVETFYDPSLICESLEEYHKLVETLPDDKFQQTDIPKPKLSKSADWIPTKANAALKFPISNHYIKIKNLRAEYKVDGNPIQEIFKLILNSTYGIMASLVLAVNNPVAANWITSCARAAAWRMTNALNGFAPITDGTGACLEHIPFGQKFRDILKRNPEYLIKFDPSITNDFDKNWMPENEKSFNNIFIQHIEEFIGGSDWLTRMYKYELKDEKNSNGVKHYTYSKHYNTGAGNYVKSGTWGDKQKTRSYQNFSKLTEWYKSVCEVEYKEHIIYVEKEVVKLSQGSEDALRILKDADNLANRQPPKKSVKMTHELAIEIAQEGIAHPMGFSKESVKLMKLISPSQFNCQDVEQFKVLNRLYQKLTSISKDILPKRDWGKTLNKELLESFVGYDSQGKEYPIEVLDYDYAGFNLKSPIGLGFEILIFGNKKLKSIQDVRVRINEKLKEYKRSSNKNQFNLNAYLHISEIITNLKSCEYLTHLLAATQILKLNLEMNYRSVLCASQLQPTLRNVTFSDLTYLKSENEKI